MLRSLAIIAGLFVVANASISACSSTAWSKEPPKIVEPKQIILDEEGIAQLRMFKKEIARLQYTEICATVQKIPDVVMKIGQGAEEAAKQGDPNAKALLEWLGPIVEKYQKAGCGDA
jgi:hypothetical protein